MQAMQRNEGGLSERGGNEGESLPPPNLDRDRGYAQIFGVWGREGCANAGGQNYCWDDIMALLDADLKDNHATSMADIASNPQIMAGQRG